MRYAEIKPYDTANGPGVRVSLFTQGCTHHCHNCFNPETWDFDGGKEFTMATIDRICMLGNRDEISGLSILGGDPFQADLDMMFILLRSFQKKVGKPIWVWTGYTINELMKDPKKACLLLLVDVLVDGPFIESKKNLRLKHRGSSNQRVIDTQKTMRNFLSVNYDSIEESIVLYEE